MIQLGQRVSRMLQIGIRHRRIFTLDVHAVDFTGMDRIHDLNDGQAAHRIEFLTPELLEGAAHVVASDRLIVRQKHRDQAGVGSALHVVLSTERVQAGAGAADLAGDQCQRDQAARVVGAVHVLADAHAPEDDRRLGLRVGARDFAQRLGRNAANRGHLLRGELDDLRLQVIVTFGVAGDVLIVCQTFRDDGVDHRVQHRNVTSRLEREMLGRMPGQRLPPRVHHIEFRAAFCGVLDEGRGDRMVDRWIRADHPDDLRVCRSRERSGHGARAQPFEQRGDR